MHLEIITSTMNFVFLEAFLITYFRKRKPLLLNPVSYFLDSKMGDTSSPHPTAIVILSSNPESDLDIPDSYNHYIGIATQVQLLNDDPDLPIYQLGLSSPTDTEIITRKLLLKQFLKSAIAKRNPPLCNKNAVF